MIYDEYYIEPCHMIRGRLFSLPVIRGVVCILLFF